MVEITLAPHHDAAVYARAFAAAGRVHIPGFLREEDARRLHETLVKRTPWNVFVIHDGPKIMPLAHWQGMNPAERKDVDDQIAAAARLRFEARFLNWPLSETGAPFPGLAPELDALTHFLNGETFLAFTRAVTGNGAIAFADAQASCYRAGDFLHRHSDEVSGKNRIAAYVLNLTPRWQPEWGGLLNFMRPDGHVDEAYVPAWNALNLLKVPQDHFVSQVASFVDVGRFAVTGWVRHR
jgi:SM-20-related protein